MEPKAIEPEALLAEAGTVRRLAQALVRRRDLAHDVAQDVLLTALQAPQAPGHLRGWLAAVTRHLAGKSLRAQRRRERVEAAVAPLSFGDGEVRTIERVRLHRRLADAVLALPEPYRTTVTLRFFDDLPPREITRLLGVSGEVVRKRLQRGLDLLRERLDGEFGDRGRWTHAFAAFGLLEAGTPWFLLAVLAMNKLALLAAAALVVSFWWWPRAEATPTVVAATEAATTAAVVGDVDPGPVVGGGLPAQRNAVAVVSVAGEDQACRVVVVDAQGRPIPDAVVHCWAEGAERAEWHATDVRGVCVFADSGGPGGLLVAADGHMLRPELLAERRGDHCIALPDGEVVDGTLSVDGLPGAGWRVSISTTVGDLPMPESLRRRYSTFGQQAVCGRNGEFRFVGLPAEWSGSLLLPQPMWFADGEPGRRSLSLAGPRRQLELRALMMPTVRGRVVWSDTGEGVAWANVAVRAEFADGQHSDLIEVETQRDGAFAVGVWGWKSTRAAEWYEPAKRPELRNLLCEVAKDDLLVGTRLELNAEQVVAQGDVVMVVERQRTTHFLCRDAQGEPIAGARLATRSISDPTDTEGRGTFAGTVEDVQLVGSPQHRIGPVAPQGSATGTRDDPLVFVLEPTNVVRFHVLGGGADKARLRVWSSEKMFAGGRSSGELDRKLHGSPFVERVRGRTQADGSSKTYEHSLHPVFDERGEAIVWSLEPGRSCEFCLEDAFGRSLVGAPFTAPPFAEQADVGLRMPEGGRAFCGRVVDDAGLPLAQTSIHFLRADGTGDYANASTATDGTFSLDWPGDVSGMVMWIFKDGYAEEVVTTLLVTTPPATYVLHAGRELTVHVVDEHDRPCEVIPVWRAARGEREEHRDWLSEGVYRWRNLPAGIVTIVCRIGADEFTLQHDTAQPVATLRIPRPGTLQLTWGGGKPKTADPRSDLFAIATCRDAKCEPFRIEMMLMDPNQILPGLWHIELWESRPGDPGLPRTERSLGLCAEVQVRAGEAVVALMH